MIKGIFLAGRSMDSKFKTIEVIGNNLANVNTTGFKKATPFNEVISKYNKIDVQQFTNYSQGNLVATNNPLDLSITGNAFFSIQGKNGLEFTRNGKFSISENGFLVNDKGDKVLGNGGPINFNNMILDKNHTIKISKEGEVKVGDLVVDRLQLVKLDSPDKFIRKDGNDFSSQTGKYIPADVNEYHVNQGYLEESNVNPIEEMTNMIKVHNEYDSASKMVKFLDQSLSEANEIGKV
jgi:flagellar basal body rod protein FlgG